MISLNRLEDSPESNANVTHPFDERKPRIPYVKGWHFTVQNHTPPRPTVNEIPMSCEFKNREDAIKVERLHPIERCLQYPPLPGSYSSCSLELQIRGTIRIGDRHHSQVVLVEVITASPSVNGLSQGQCVVAKLYDPMYIDMMSSSSTHSWLLRKATPLRQQLTWTSQIFRALLFHDTMDPILLISLLGLRQQTSAASDSY